MEEQLTPFDFINSVSQSKTDLISGEYADEIEKQYNPWIVNRGLSLFQDTILYANEMNGFPELFKDAQYRYYLGSLRSRKRFSKWPKLEKNDDLDLIQELMSCNRTIAKQYLKLLSEADLKKLKETRNIGGDK